MSRAQDYITEARGAAKQLWDAYLKLRALQAEWDAQDYGTTLSDGEGHNEGYTKAEVGAVVFATADAIKTVMDAGNATNVTSLL